MQLYISLFFLDPIVCMMLKKCLVRIKSSEIKQASRQIYLYF